jgi:hypothetical protein
LLEQIISEHYVKARLAFCNFLDKNRDACGVAWIGFDQGRKNGGTNGETEDELQGAIDRALQDCAVSIG